MRKTSACLAAAARRGLPVLLSVGCLFGVGRATWGQLSLPDRLALPQPPAALPTPEALLEEGRQAAARVTRPTYGQSVAKLGQSLNNNNAQLANQQIVEQMLLRQRDAVSGVSLDEEMTDLIKFQRAFEANARLITTVDEMLQTVVNLGR